MIRASRLHESEVALIDNILKQAKVIHERERNITNLYETVLWWITAPVRWVWEPIRVVSINLRWRLHRMYLVPVEDLVVEGDRFRSLGDDPVFLLRSARKRLPRRWVLIYYRADSSDTEIAPRLYINRGDGFSEKTAVSLTPSFVRERDGRTRTLIKLPYRVKALRLDPCEKPCIFSMDSLTIREVGRFLLFWILVWRKLRPTLHNPLLTLPLLRHFLGTVIHGGPQALEQALLDEEVPPQFDWNHDAYPRAEPPRAPTKDEWGALAQRQKATAELPAAPVVDVIIPVYRGFDETMACIYSVVAAPVETAHEVIVIDDAGPEKGLRLELARLAGQGLFTLLHNDTNLGFVATVNKGMNLNPDRDVVLLNSDTVVYGNWLDRLSAIAISQARIGSVTPLSNNAEIFSYPIFVQDNDMRLELDDAALDRMTAAANAGATVEVPTAGGFCMYIRRACLNDVGLFDAERFGQGYGEENDFCLRASVRGWTHLLAGEVFVRHWGAASFRTEKKQRIAKALKVLHQRFPSYNQIIREFIAKDPGLLIRRRLDLARLKRQNSDRSILFVIHNRGGGAERHAQDMRNWLEEEGISVFFLRPVPGRPHLVRLSHPKAMATPNFPPFDTRIEPYDLAKILKEIGIDHIHIHQLADFDTTAPDWLTELVAELGIGYDVTIHDYASICPRINLIDGSGVYCGEPEPSVCNKCITVNGSAFGRVSIVSWRHSYAGLLAGARRVFVPNIDVQQRLERYFPAARFSLRPHPETFHSVTLNCSAEHKDGEPLRVAIIGALGPHKGFDLIRSCALDAMERNLPIRFIIFGITSGPVHDLSNVTTTGEYREEEIYTLLEKHRCHLAFFSSVCPETYSYTLSIALNARLYPIAFDLGAIAQRIREAGWGELLPLEWMNNSPAVNDHMLKLDIPQAPPQSLVPIQEESDVNFVADYYDDFSK